MSHRRPSVFLHWGKHRHDVSQADPTDLFDDLGEFLERRFGHPSRDDIPYGDLIGAVGEWIDSRSPIVKTIIIYHADGSIATTRNGGTHPLVVSAGKLMFGPPGPIGYGADPRIHDN